MFTRRARVRPEPRLYSVNLKATGAPEILKSALRRGPHQSRYERARVDARSLRLPQRIIIDFVQALVSLLLGVAMAFLADHFDHTLRSNVEAERYLGLPVLGSVKRRRRRLIVPL